MPNFRPLRRKGLRLSFLRFRLRGWKTSAICRGCLQTLVQFEVHGDRAVVAKSDVRHNSATPFGRNAAFTGPMATRPRKCHRWPEHGALLGNLGERGWSHLSGSNRRPADYTSVQIFAIFRPISRFSCCLCHFLCRIVSRNSWIPMSTNGPVPSVNAKAVRMRRRGRRPAWPRIRARGPYWVVAQVRMD